MFHINNANASKDAMSVADQPGQVQPSPQLQLNKNRPPRGSLRTGFGAFGRGVAQEGRFLRRGLTAWPLAVLVLAATVCLGLAYQVPVDWQFAVGRLNASDHLYLRSFNPAEPEGAFSFRWSSSESYLRFPGSGRLPSARLELEMQSGGRPASLGLPKVQLWDTATNRLLSEVEVQPEPKTYRFDYRAEGSKLEGDLVFTLKVADAFRDPGHNLPLGVVLTSVRLRGGPSDGRPVLPSFPHLALLLAGLVVFYLALARAGWSAGRAAWLSGVLLAAAAFALAAYRFHLTPAVSVLFLTLLLSYPLLVLGLRATAAWLSRRGQAFPATTARWLALIFVAAFVFKATGLNHPSFRVVDHWFRIHQINRFWEHPADFWQQYFNVSTGATVTGLEGGSAVLGQWGVQVSLPYSPLFYLLAAPLSLLWPSHNDPNLLAAVNDLASWLEVSQVFLLYIILKRSFALAWAERAAIFAAAIFGFYPLGFLLFSDGGYNSILAGWLSLLFVALLVDWLRLTEEGWPVSRWHYAWLGLALGFSLLSHTSTLLLVGAFVVVLTFGLLARRRWHKAGRRLALVGLAGFGLALVLYYGWYVPSLLTRTLPTLFERLGTGGLGQDRKLLGSNLLTGFWPQLWEHFRLWPFLLALVALAALVRLSAIGRPQGAVKDQPIVNQNAVFPLVLGAALVVFALFSLLDLRVNLLQKHMLFVAPFLCLGSGVALSLAWEGVSGWAARRKNKLALWVVGAAISGLLLVNLVQGLLIWYARVYYTTYPPGSG